MPVFILRNFLAVSQLAFVFLMVGNRNDKYTL
jgi:hypothetical protein